MKCDCTSEAGPSHPAKKKKEMEATASTPHSSSPMSSTSNDLGCLSSVDKTCTLRHMLISLFSQPTIAPYRVLVKLGTAHHITEKTHNTLTTQLPLHECDWQCLVRVYNARVAGVLPPSTSSTEMLVEAISPTLAPSVSPPVDKTLLPETRPPWSTHYCHSAIREREQSENEQKAYWVENWLRVEPQETHNAVSCMLKVIFKLTVPRSCASTMPIPQVWFFGVYLACFVDTMSS
ncbi:hypothetical protein C8F01DRAFT_1083801 [Mycena amicta]|nr:hypothetical protein C8F01DRAFT_1083801 [Mycena amicta]